MSTDSDDRLRLHIEAIETLNEEKKDKADEIKDRFALAKSEGYDPTAMKTVLKRRAMERAAREELDEIVRLYEEALGG